MSSLPVAFNQSINIGLEAITLTHGGDSDSDFLYLKMDKTGHWLFGRGRDDNEIEHGSEWVVNPLTAQSGYISWDSDGGGGPKGEQMAPLTGAPVVQASLPDTGFPWVSQLSVQMMCISGDDVGTAVIYKTSSKGGVKVINKLLREVLARSKTGKNEVYPVLTLASYQDKGSKYKTWYPVLDQKDWVHTENFTALTLPGAETEQLEAAPEPEPVIEEVLETPAPRRRRRKATA
jgi:hypothetical protein